MRAEHRMVVTFANGKVKRYAKPSRAKAIDDAHQTRLEIAGSRDAKHWRISKGTSHLAPYWRDATVTVESRGVPRWEVIDETELP